jgi:outer membrane protein assembly factor BamD (BamD/ComL family)
MDVAHAALARGNERDALAAIGRHEAEFADGQLLEEREAMRIQAYARSGDVAQARALAERFFQRFPRSFMRGAIENALDDAP